MGGLVGWLVGWLVGKFLIDLCYKKHIYTSNLDKFFSHLALSLLFHLIFSVFFLCLVSFISFFPIFYNQRGDPIPPPPSRLRSGSNNVVEGFKGIRA